MTTNIKIKLYFFIVSVFSSFIINAQNVWTPIDSITNYSLSSVFFIGNTGYTIGGNGQTNQNAVYKTLDGGATWSSIITTNEFYSIFFTNVDTGYAIDGNGFLKTVDGGANWSRVFQNNSLTKYSFMNSIYFTNANTGYIVGGFDYKQGTILKTNDGGINWVEQDSRIIFYLNTVYFVDANTGYSAGSHGRIIKTINGGNNWTILSSGTLYTLNSIFFVGNLGYVVGDNGVILKTTNGGANWNSLNSGTTNNLNAVFFTDAYTGYAVGGKDTIINGIFLPYKETILKTLDGGVTWINQSSGLNKTLYSVYFTDSITGYAVGRNGAIIKTGGNPTFINNTELQEISIYPNPVDDKIYISNTQKAIIEIINTRGEIVKTIKCQDLKTTIDIRSLSSGLYILRVVTDNGIINRKFIKK